MKNSRGVANPRSFHLEGLGFDFQTLGLHFAPDLDTVMSVALLCEHLPGLNGCPVQFFAAGHFGKQWYNEQKRRGVLFIDIGGLSPLDHHGNGNGNGSAKLSATHLTARLLGLENEEWLQPLIQWVDLQDREGTNFSIRAVEGNQSHSAHQLLFTTVVRGSSQCRYKPNNGVTIERQIQACWRLVDWAQLLIRHLKLLNGKPLQLTKGLNLYQWTLVRTIAKIECCEPPAFFEDFSSALDEINRSVNEDNEEPENRFDCREMPISQQFIRLAEPAKLEADHPLALNFTLAALAEALVAANMPYTIRIAMMDEAWACARAIIADWQECASEIKNQIFDKALLLRRCGQRQWSVIGTQSGHVQIAKALRHRFKAEVIIVQRPSGQCQITCLTPRPSDKRSKALLPLMKQAAACLRQAEAEKRGWHTLNRGASYAVGQTIAHWHLADFGGVFNGSLTNPYEEPTKLTLQEIFKIVCAALSVDGVSKGEGME